MYTFLRITVIACGLLFVLNLESTSAAAVRSNDLIKEDVEVIGGFVLFRMDRGKREYLLLEKDSEPGDWSNPKGHADGDEIPIDAAFREMREETTLLPQHYELILGLFEYFEYETKDGAKKKVSLWPARLIDTNHPIVISEESRDYKWADTAETLSIVKKQYKQAFVNILQKLSCHYDTEAC